VADWQGYNLGDIFPTEMETLVQTGATIATSAGSLLTTIGTFMEGLSYLITDFADPVAAITVAVQGLINTYLADFMGTDIWMLSVGPGARVDGYAQSIGSFNEKIAQSFWDTSDPGRPIFSESAAYAGIVLMAGAPTYTAFKAQLNTLTTLFKDDRFKKIAEDLTVAIAGAFLLETVAGSSALQDIKLNSISGFPQEGPVKIGNERTYYTGLGQNSIKKCRVRRTHQLGESADVLETPLDNPGITKLTLGVAAGATQLQVEDATKFPDSGSIIIGDDLINYDAKSDTILKDLVTSKPHPVGAIVTLKSGRQTIGEPPDWHEANLMRVLGPMGDLFTGIDIMNASFDAAGQMSTALANLGKLLKEKGVRMQAIATDIQTALTEFQAILAGSGFYMLKISGGSGGPAQFIADLKSAGAAPPFGASAFTAGYCMYAGTGGLGPLELLFG